MSRSGQLERVAGPSSTRIQRAKPHGARCRRACAADGSQRLVLMSVTQSLMDVMSLCAVVAFTELDEAGRKVAETQHRWGGWGCSLGGARGGVLLVEAARRQ